MKRLIILLVIVCVTIPAQAQLALKGGVSYAKNELSNYVITAQFYKDLLVVSGDVFIPTQRPQEIGGAGRIGIGFGGERFRLAADIGAMYERKYFRFGYGAEGNLRLYGPIGIFARWTRTYPIFSRGEYDDVAWNCKRSEISLGVVVDLIDWGFY